MIETMARYAVVVAAIAALAITAALGFVLIPLLRRLKFGQSINEIGPTWHKGKQGTPTMGGFLFIIGSIVGTFVALPLLAGVTSDLDPAAGGLMLLAIFTSLAFGAVGFIDDFLKVVRKQNLGLRAWQKIFLQIIIAVCFLVTLHLMGRLTTIVQLPFLAQPVDFGFFFYPISLILIIGIVNAVNLTDGIDGLASLVTLWVMCGYFILLTLFEKYQLSIWAAALAGGCIGFLIWNFHPAKVFMGDTGSMFLGGAVVAIGYCMGRPDILIILALVYIMEAFSVILQVLYFKATKGKRLFKMSPIHHHFELSGWSEGKIDAVFSLLTILCVVLAYIYAYVLG